MWKGLSKSSIGMLVCWKRVEKECCGISTFHVGQARAWCYVQGNVACSYDTNCYTAVKHGIDLWLNKCQQITRVTQCKLYIYPKHSTQPLLPTRRLLAQFLPWQCVHPSVHPSVTLVYCIWTAEDNFKLLFRPVAPSF